MGKGWEFLVWCLLAVVLSVQGWFLKAAEAPFLAKMLCASILAAIVCRVAFMFFESSLPPDEEQ